MESFRTPLRELCTTKSDRLGGKTSFRLGETGLGGGQGGLSGRQGGLGGRQDRLERAKVVIPRNCMLRQGALWRGCTDSGLGMTGRAGASGRGRGGAYMYI